MLVSHSQRKCILKIPSGGRTSAWGSESIGHVLEDQRLRTLEHPLALALRPQTQLKVLIRQLCAINARCRAKIITL